MFHDNDDMDPFDCMVKQVLQLFMADVVITVSRYGLRIEACHKNQPNKSKLALYNPLLSV